MFTRSRRPESRDAAVARPTGQEERHGEPVTERKSADETALERIGLLWTGDLGADPTTPFTGTGAQVASGALAPSLARHGEFLNVDVFARYTGIDGCRQQFQGLPAHVYGGETAVARLFLETELPARLREHRYAVMHDPSSDLTRLAYVRSRLSRRVFPVTCSQHATSYSFQLYGQFIPLLAAHLYPCDAMVCLTNSSRRAMANRLSDIAEQYSRVWDRPPPRLPRLELIPWGVDTQRFAPRDPVAARRDLNLPIDRPIILCVGRIRIQDKMDCAPLLLAFERARRMAKERPLLVLAGATFSEASTEITAQAEQIGVRADLRTFFNLPPACLASLYAACDVFVSPTDSPSESFGLTIVEAMASGLPVVASDWDGYKELIVHGETGFKVRTDWADCLGELNELAPLLSWDHHHLHVGQSVSVDVPQMASYLAQLVENRELREKMGRQARERAEALYDWRVVVRQWEAMWKELSAIARTLECQESHRLDYLQPNYFKYFSHYASRIVDDATTVQITAQGRDLLAGKTPLLLHPWAKSFLQPHNFHAILASLKSAKWMGAGLAVGELVSILRASHGLGRDAALMHLMWLAKYGLVSFNDALLPT